MTDKIYMEIGGVHFSVSSAKSNIPLEHDPAYGSFFKKAGLAAKSSETIGIKVHLELLDRFDSEKLEKIFDSGQTWSMFRDGEDYWLVRHPPAFKEPLCAACFKRDIKDITFYWGREFIKVKDGKNIFSNLISYFPDQLLSMYILARHKGLIVHAAGIEFAGKGFMFAGPSGAGKSTLTRLFYDESLQNPQKQPGLLSDERIIVREINGSIRAFGTPWPGEAGIAQNKSAPLSGIFFLCHNKTNRIKKITPGQALGKILKVISIPWYDRDIMPNMLSLCEDLILRVPLFELHFTPGRDVVKLLQEFNPDNAYS